MNILKRVLLERSSKHGWDTQTNTGREGRELCSNGSSSDDNQKQFDNLKRFQSEEVSFVVHFVTVSLKLIQTQIQIQWFDQLRVQKQIFSLKLKSVLAGNTEGIIQAALMSSNWLARLKKDRRGKVQATSLFSSPLFYIVTQIENKITQIGAKERIWSNSIQLNVY